MEKNPILFVHGIGASAAVWSKMRLPDRGAYYLSFSKPFANPNDQVPELKAEIDHILDKEKKDKVVLVCHSMGGLTARRYLQENMKNHRVEKLILISTPNHGSVALSFNLVPYLMIITGVIWMQWIWPLLFLVAGFIWEWLSFIHGITLLSPAVFAMRPDSHFIAEINSLQLPEDVEYIALLSDTEQFPYFLANFLVFWGRGDGAVPLSSQMLSHKTAPNFERLRYSEKHIDLPHFVIPQKVHQFLPQVLG